MKSKIFTGEAEEFRSSVRAVPIKACEAGNLLSYKGFKIPEDSQTNKPNNNKINKKDTVQKATLTGLAKVYSARITKSQISLNNY